jgi:hypothetical protein
MPVAVAMFFWAALPVNEWGGISERKVVQPGLPNSVEELMHETDKTSFYVSMRADDRVSAEPLDDVRPAEQTR